MNVEKIQQMVNDSKIYFDMEGYNHYHIDYDSSFHITLKKDEAIDYWMDKIKEEIAKKDIKLIIIDSICSEF